VSKKKGGAKDMKRLLNKASHVAGFIYRLFLPDEEAIQRMIDNHRAVYGNYYD